MENIEIDWDAWVKKQALMIIKMDLDSLPENLEKLTDTSYGFASAAEKTLKEEAEKAFADIAKMPENVEYTDEGEPYCEKFWIESQAEDYFCEQGSFIELYESSLHKMLINLFVETVEGLDKRIVDELKKAGIEAVTFKESVFKPVMSEDMEKVRLINNCIKHSDCIVSKELHSAYFAEYSKGDKINLDQKLVYDLLKITQDAITHLQKLFERYYLSAN